MADRIDDIVFAEMEYATADKTAVDLLGDKPRITKENVHDMLMAAGFTPGLGNVADVADAVLYAAEGEFGNAALSVAAMIPFIGQAVSTKRALKIAKESGEDMITFYRGIDQWHPGKMVKEGNWVGGGHYMSKHVAPKTSLWVAEKKDLAKNFMSSKYATKRNVDLYGEMDKTGHMLEFKVPKSYVIDNFNMPGVGRIKDNWSLKYLTKEISSKSPVKGLIGYFPEGLPKEFLTKVHK